MPQKDPEVRKAYARAWYQVHKERVSKWHAEYRAANLEKILKQGREYQATRRLVSREYDREYRAANFEKERERVRLWQAANSDKKRETNRVWHVTNREKRTEYTDKRRAIKLGAFVEAVDRAKVFLNDAGICQWRYCSQPSPYVDSNNWHLDHNIPLSKGGEHSYLNTQVMHPVCNLEKSDRLID